MYGDVYWEAVHGGTVEVWILSTKHASSALLTCLSRGEGISPSTKEAGTAVT